MALRFSKEGMGNIVVEGIKYRGLVKNKQGSPLE